MFSFPLTNQYVLIFFMFSGSRVEDLSTIFLSFKSFDHVYIFLGADLRFWLGEGNYRIIITYRVRPSIFSLYQCI
jgi:hypothetical protein